MTRFKKPFAILLLKQQREGKGEKKLQEKLLRSFLHYPQKQKHVITAYPHYPTTKKNDTKQTFA